MHISTYSVLVARFPSARCAPAQKRQESEPCPKQREGRGLANSRGHCRAESDARVLILHDAGKIKVTGISGRAREARFSYTCSHDGL